MKQSSIAFLSLILLAQVCLSQTPNNKGLPPANAREEEERKVIEEGEAEFGKDFDKLAAARALKGAKLTSVPKGERAWAIQVVTSGGIMGTGKGSLSLTSNGEVTCTRPATCIDRLTPSSLNVLTVTLDAVTATRFDGMSISTCNDCYSTTVVLQRRDEKGQTRIFLYHWDDVTAAKVPGDVMRLHDNAFRLAWLHPSPQPN